MKFATKDDGSRDGQLILVNKDLSKWISCRSIAPNLQDLLDNWDLKYPELVELNEGFDHHCPRDLADIKLHSPLPRAYEWIDGSAYINHILLVRKARNAKPPETIETDPLVYQGGSGVFLAPTQDIPLVDKDWGLDFESEICVILGDTPRGVKASEAHKYIKLVMLANDVSLRNLIPEELAKGFGFFNSKPATAFSPICVTPEELGDSWVGGRLHLPLFTYLNGKKFGDPEAGPEMHFSFFDLIEHITKTRSYTAGTIVGSGTVSNEDRSRGSSCLAEKRMIEKIDTGKIETEFLAHGDKIKIEMLDKQGKSIFGQICQQVSQV